MNNAASIDAVRDNALEGDVFVDDEAACLRPDIGPSAAAPGIVCNQIEGAIQAFSDSIRSTRIVFGYVGPEVEHILMRPRPQFSPGHSVAALHSSGGALLS